MSSHEAACTEQTEQKESLVRPGTNLQFLTWLILLGLPALLVFMVLQQQHENAHPINTPMQSSTAYEGGH